MLVKWKYYCLCILQLDSAIFLKCFVHALLKRQTVLLSNKLHSRLEHAIVLYPVMDLRLGNLLQPLAAPINCTLSTVEVLVQIWVFPNRTHPPFYYFLSNKDVHQKRLMEIFFLYVTGHADAPVHWAAN